MSRKANNSKNAEKNAPEASQNAETPAEGIAQTREASKVRAKLQPYFDAHPKVDRFFVTSDNQPFFEKQWAREHQQSIDPSREVITVNR